MNDQPFSSTISDTLSKFGTEVPSNTEEIKTDTSNTVYVEIMEILQDFLAEDINK